jgi:hypothetical protein
MDLASSYVEVIETTPSRLYDQEREEVHTGLVSRAAREVIAALGAPDLWCSEHGSHVGRVLIETRILLEWMAMQDQASVYRKYQDFGAGKANSTPVLLPRYRMSGTSAVSTRPSRQSKARATTTSS